jgi:hypothetical protein
MKILENYARTTKKIEHYPHSIFCYHYPSDTSTHRPVRAADESVYKKI